MLFTEEVNALSSKLHPDERRNVLLFLGCWLAYTITCFAKSNYTASVAYIVSQEIFSKANAGIISSAFYAFYGVGQFFGGRIVDKYSPYTMISIGVLGAVIANIILCITNNFWIVVVVWSLSGCIQFGVYPGVCRIISTDILPEFRNKANIFMQYGLPLSSIVSYLCSMTLLEFWGWSAMFASSTVTLLATLIFWLYICKTQPKSQGKKEPEPKIYRSKLTNTTVKFLPFMFSSGIIFMLFVTMSSSLLNNGAQVWIPTMIMESYFISPVLASLQTIFLLLIQIVAILFIKPFLNYIKNPVFGQFVCYLICLVPLFILQFIGRVPLTIAIIMLALMTMLTKISGAFGMQLVFQFGRFGFSGTYAGLTNAITSFGIVLASAFYGVLADGFGWTAITAAWLILAALSVIFIIPAVILWKKTLKKFGDI